MKLALLDLMLGGEELTKSTHTLCSRDGIKTPIQWKLLFYYLSYCFLNINVVYMASHTNQSQNNY